MKFPIFFNMSLKNIYMGFFCNFDSIPIVTCVVNKLKKYE
jgi:hypothetical protein